MNQEWPVTKPTKYPFLRIQQFSEFFSWTTMILKASAYELGFVGTG